MLRVRRLTLTAVLLCTALAVSVRDAAACSCVGSPVAKSPAEVEAEIRADLTEFLAVFSGRVIQADMLKVTFEVDSVWKGEIAKERVMRTGAVRNADGSITISSCSFSFRRGEAYLVFAYGSSLETMGASSCSRTTLVQDADETIHHLDRIIGRIAFAQRESAAAALAVARKKWASRRIKNYEFTFQAHCFCDPAATGAVTFRVVEGRAVLTSTVPEGVRPFFDSYETVEKLFAFVEMALEKRASKLSAQYDSKFGYPSAVDVDYRQTTADDEMRFTVRDFKILQESRR